MADDDVLKNTPVINNHQTDTTVSPIDVQNTTVENFIRRMIINAATPDTFKNVKGWQGKVMRVVTDPINFENSSRTDLETYIKGANHVPIKYKVLLLNGPGKIFTPPKTYSETPEDKHIIDSLDDYSLSPSFGNKTLPVGADVWVTVESYRDKVIEYCFSDTLDSSAAPSPAANQNQQNNPTEAQAKVNSPNARSAFSSADVRPTFQPKQFPPASKDIGTPIFDSLYTNPPIKAESCEKNPEKYKKVIDQFQVATNPRYKPGKSPSAKAPPNGKYTWCNIFGWDVSMAMGCRIYPHFFSLRDQQVNGVQLKEGQPVNNNYTLEFAGGGIKEADANVEAVWFKTYATQFGWKVLADAEEAQKYANLGRLVIGSWENTKPGARGGGQPGAGHVIVIRPNENGYNKTLGPRITQAGGHNYNDTYFNSICGVHAVNLYIYATPVCPGDQ